MSMNHPSGGYLFLLSLVAAAPMMPIAAEGVVGRPPSDCIRNCSGIEIPYPFGLKDDPAGHGCYRDSNYSLVCNHSYKLFYDDVEIIGLNISSAQAKILFDICYDCYVNSNSHTVQWWNASFPWPYRFSNSDNLFTAVGCETAAQFRIGRSYGGCISGCESENIAVEGQCSGFGCCQTPIPKDVSFYETRYYPRDDGSETYKFNPCSYSFMVEKNNYTFHKSDLKSMDKNRMFPVVLDWAIRDDSLSCEEAKKNRTTYACVSDHSECLDSQNGPGYICNCSEGYDGNPYLQGGCQDINECITKTSPCKGICVNTIGGYNCTCPKGSHSPDPRIQECIKSDETLFKLTIGIISGTCGGLGILLVLGGSCLFYKTLKKKKAKKLRQTFFGKNYRLLLDKMDNVDGALNVRTFSLKEMEKATNNFDTSRILGSGGQGVVYKGLLSDKRVVAIKKFKEGKPQADGRIKRQIAQYINEIAVLFPIDHRNVVKLLGCCLEIEVPILVYEFISNGTLSDHLHDRNRPTPLSWDDRLRIATEIATAVTYLHSAASKFIIHRDLKSSNILLDEGLNVKVSDFGASKSLVINRSHVTTVVQGTFGYLDPEYHRTGRLTEKSDAYSLGVILVELLTGEKLVSMERSPEEKYLIPKFITAMEENQVLQIVEASIQQEVRMEELEVVAKLAGACLRQVGGERPAMREVATILQSLRKTKKKQYVQNLPELDACNKIIACIINSRHNETSLTQFSYIEESMESMSFPR